MHTCKIEFFKNAKIALQYTCDHVVSMSTVTETAAPMLACSGCQLLDTIQFCSTVVYSRLITEMRGEPSRFHFQPDDCLATANDDRDFLSSGPDCMPPPQGLPTGTGESLFYCAYSISL